MTRRYPFILTLAMAAVGLAAGCSPAQVADLKQVRDEVALSVTEGKASAEQLQAQVKALPPGDPVRRTLEDSIAKVLKYTAEAERRLPLLDAAIRSAESGQVDPALVTQVSTLPYIGPYAGLAFTLGSLAFGIWQRGQRKQTERAFGQVVKSVDAAMPDKTEAQKTAMAAVQDESTRLLVSKIKGD